MNIAIIGYGRMGHEIESLAKARGHNIKLIIDLNNPEEINKIGLAGVDVAIEFTTPDSAFGNIARCLESKVPVVSGTTGWLRDYDKAAAICLKSGTSFIHSSNFSIGVNILFRLNAELARYMSGYPEYTPFIEEIHHIKKLDAPSGTAVTLAEGIGREHPGYSGWRFEHDEANGRVPVRSVREGTVPGTHTVTWDSEIDTLSLRHEAKGRKGLALGAVIAAEFIHNRKGVFTMNNILGF
ncbi:MAG: dihydrodipicolinate reductase C-terminal domain-containing protein [Bacteroidales bacterium]